MCSSDLHGGHEFTVGVAPDRAVDCGGEDSLDRCGHDLCAVARVRGANTHRPHLFMVHRRSRHNVRSRDCHVAGGATTASERIAPFVRPRSNRPKCPDALDSLLRNRGTHSVQGSVCTHLSPELLDRVALRASPCHPVRRRVVRQPCGTPLPASNSHLLSASLEPPSSLVPESANYLSRRHRDKWNLVKTFPTSVRDSFR